MNHHRRRVVSLDNEVMTVKQTDIDAFDWYWRWSWWRMRWEVIDCRYTFVSSGHVLEGMEEWSPLS